MAKPPVPLDEGERLDALHALRILDTPPEERFDRITRLARRTFDVPIALVSLVDETRQWFKSCQGLDATQTGRDVSFCGHTILSDDPLVVPDARLDPRFADNPLVTAAPFIRFYAGQPLHTAGGQRIGTLCVIDSRPRQFGPDDRRVLKDLAAIVTDELNAVRREQTFGDLVLLSESGATLAQHLSPSDIAGELVERIAAVCPVPASTVLVLVQQHGGTFRLISGHGPRPSTSDGMHVDIGPLPDDEVSRLLESEQPLLCSDAAAARAIWDRLAEHLPAIGTARIGYLLPLVSRERLVAITVMAGAARPTAVQREILAIIGRAAAGALDRHRLHDALLRRIARLETLTRLNRLVSSSLELDVLLVEIARAAARLMGATIASFWLVDETSRSLRLHAFSNQAMGADQHVRRAAFGEGAVGWVAEHRRPLVLEDVFADGRTGGLAWWAAHGLRSSCTVPVLLDGTLLAILSLNGTGPISYGAEEQELLDSLMGQAAVAIRNATLFAERQHAERKARDEKELFRTLSDSSPIGIFVTDTDGRCRYTNARWQEIAGLTLAESLDDGWSRAIHPIDRETVFALWNETTGQRREFFAEFRFVTPRGEVRWVHSRAAGIRDAAGRLTGYVGSVEDITDRKRAMEDMREALAVQQQANEQLRRLNLVKSDFVSMVSHEFRTPLTGIQGFSEMIRDEALSDEETREFAADINKEARRLARLINDMLDLDRLESGKVVLHTETVDLNALVRDTIESVRPPTATHPVRLVLDPGLPILRGDRDKLTQIVTNLLSNAIKYSPRGGEIDIRTTFNTATVHLTVRDHGIGIPHDALETIFERYARVESRPLSQVQGTGLGLPIVRQIAHLHGGRAWAEGVTDGGSRFHVVLPLAGSPARG